MGQMGHRQPGDRIAAEGEGLAIHYFERRAVRHIPDGRHRGGFAAERRGVGRHRQDFIECATFVYF